MAFKYDALVAIENKKQDGTVKTNWVKVGAGFENEKGISIKLDVVPIGTGWNGYISLRTPKPRDNQPAAASAGGDFAADMADDVPF